MSIFARIVLKAGLVNLVLRTISAQLHSPRSEWVKVPESQRLAVLLLGLVSMLFAVPSVFACWILIRVIVSMVGAWSQVGSPGLVLLLALNLILSYGLLQYAIIGSATAFLNFVIAWRGAKPPSDLFAVIMATNWTDVR
jgi:hypothetical protein